MAFIDNLSKKISKAGQSTLQKTKDLADTAKLNSAISEEEKKINLFYTEIGRRYYAAHSEDAETEFDEQMRAIKNAEEKINTYRKTIQTMKATVRCSVCGAEVSGSVAFCGECGAPMGKADAPGMVTCSACGSQVRAGLKFCTACGNPMQADVPAEPPATEPPVPRHEAPKKRCSNCGAEIDLDADFCTECGKMLV